ncbi:MAG: putative toxin-antitoxin system toxin component, PIN family [Armatimonadetes bacterium]|nr:putative toxin-antitoxin system toxin component, PIN family [Armatimonadota bacterium]
MTSDQRYVFDTNALVSAALLARSVSRQAFELACDTGEVIVSAETIVELVDVLRRPKFDRYVPEVDRAGFVARLITEATAVEVRCRVRVCRDADDDKFLALAVSGAATCVVTGDKDLLDLHPFRGIAILTPRQFLDRPSDEPRDTAET